MENDERITDITDIEESDDAPVSKTNEEPTVEETVTEIVAQKKNNTDTKKKFYLNLYDIASVVMTSFLIIAVVFTFFFRLVGVVGESMTDTLQPNDWLITVQKKSYEQGDIVVITQPNYFNQPLIKRVIAKGGQTVDIDYKSSTVYVDGIALEEPYLKDQFIFEQNGDIDFPYTVPDGCLFCMGDNRNGSTDSRSTLVGPLDERYVLGKAVFRVLPFGDFDIYDYE